MHLDACHVCIRWAAGVLPGICYLSVLYEQVACGHVSLLRNDAHPAPAGVVADHLVTNSKVQFTESMGDNNAIQCEMWVFNKGEGSYGGLKRITVPCFLLRTSVLTPWNKVLLEKPTSSQLVKDFPI